MTVLGYTSTLTASVSAAAIDADSLVTKLAEARVLGLLADLTDAGCAPYDAAAMLFG